jgi:V-type H+-transporting ATPase subunit a
MFGDIGHGLLLFLGALYMVLNSNELSKNASIKPLLKAKWLFLLMGFFAFYVGWIYNDFLSLPVGIFGTCWVNVEGNPEAQRIPNCTYPFGIDPKWYVASNELTFFNSFKMKFAVIIGVSQMMFGIVLRGMNSLYFGSKVDFICEFIPQIIFMGLLFGYMNIMIFIKWMTDFWGTNGHNTYKAPSIITMLMQIFLKMGDVVRYSI